jgi:hypothetical protein
MGSTAREGSRIPDPSATRLPHFRFGGRRAWRRCAGDDWAERDRTVRQFAEAVMARNSEGALERGGRVAVNSKAFRRTTMRSKTLAGITGLIVLAGVSSAQADGDIYVRTPRPAQHYQMIEGRAAYERPGSVYGRPGNGFGPGYPANAPSSPYRWAIGNQGYFPGAEFTRDR